MAKKQQKTYEMVDTTGLVNALAENEWKIECRTLHTDDLYELSTIVDPVTNKVEIVKEVRGKWAGLFWDLQSALRELVNGFVKKEEQ